jgi:hypothetical protein
MFAKISRGFGITGVKISTDYSAIPFSFTMGGSTLENMDTSTLDVLDSWSRFEKYINR